MRRLLLLVILFGCMSVINLAAGCNAQIRTCPEGGCVTYGQYCPVNTPSYSAPPDAPPVDMYYFILDIKNNSYQLVDLKTKNFLTALDRSLSCDRSTQVCTVVSIREYLAVVVSEDNRLFIGKADAFYKGTGKKAEKAAIDDCKKGKEANGNGVMGDGIKGKKCRLIRLFSPNFKLENIETKQKYDLKVTGSL